MRFYDLSKEEKKYNDVQNDIELALNNNDYDTIKIYFDDKDTYIR